MPVLLVSLCSGLQGKRNAYVLYWISFPLLDRPPPLLSLSFIVFAAEMAGGFRHRTDLIFWSSQAPYPRDGLPGVAFVLVIWICKYRGLAFF